MTHSLTDLADAAIDAFKAFNAERDRQQREWARSRFGKCFRGNGADISDRQHIELREEMVHFDAEAFETLQEMTWFREVVD